MGFSQRLQFICGADSGLAPAAVSGTVSRAKAARETAGRTAYSWREVKVAGGELGGDATRGADVAMGAGSGWDGSGSEDALLLADLWAARLACVVGREV